MSVLFFPHLWPGLDSIRDGGTILRLYSNHGGEASHRLSKQCFSSGTGIGRVSPIVGHHCLTLFRSLSHHPSGVMAVSSPSLPQSFSIPHLNVIVAITDTSLRQCTLQMFPSLFRPVPTSILRHLCRAKPETSCLNQPNQRFQLLLFAI